MTDASQLGERCAQLVRDVGLQAVARLCHTFAPTASGPSGVTATILLAESHLCVHTWPEQRAVTLDVYVCNFGADHSAKAQALLSALLALFEADQVSSNRLLRGQPGA